MKNTKVVIYSLIALICLYLTFTFNEFFIVPTIILMLLNQKELF